MIPQLSLVTGTLNRPDSLGRLLRSIQEHTKCSWELIIADASSAPIDESGFPNNVHVIPERPRMGHAAGFNRAFARASGDYIIFLNDDCEVTTGYAETAIRFMEEHPDIGLGCLYYSDPNHVGFKVNECCYGMQYANFGILSRKLGNQIGWLDESLTMYGSDNSLAYRVLLAGKGIAAIPGANIIHHSENDAHRIENNDMTYRVAQAELLKAKYGPMLPQMREVYERCRMVTV